MLSQNYTYFQSQLAMVRREKAKEEEIGRKEHWLALEAMREQFRD
jgi:hypothetical protein